MLAGSTRARDARHAAAGTVARACGGRPGAARTEYPRAPRPGARALSAARRGTAHAPPDAGARGSWRRGRGRGRAARDVCDTGSRTKILRVALNENH